MGSPSPSPISLSLPTTAPLDSVTAALQAFATARGDFSDLYVNDNTNTTTTTGSIRDADTESADHGQGITTIEPIYTTGGSAHSPSAAIASPGTIAVTPEHTTNTSAAQHASPFPGVTQMYENDAAAQSGELTADTQAYGTAHGNITSTTATGISAVHSAAFDLDINAAGSALSRNSTTRGAAASLNTPRTTDSEFTRITRAASRSAANGSDTNPDTSQFLGRTSSSSDNQPEVLGYSIDGVFHRFHPKRKDITVPPGYKLAAANISGGPRYPDQSHQNTANLPEQDFMSFHPPSLDLDPAQQDADLLAMGISPERIAELNVGAAASKSCKPRQKRIARPAAKRTRADVNAELYFAVVQSVSDQGIDLSAETPDGFDPDEPPSKRPKLGKTTAGGLAARQAVRRSERKVTTIASPDVDGGADEVSVTVTSDLFPAKKAKPSATPASAASIRERRRSKQNATQASLIYDADEPLGAASGAVILEPPSKKSKPAVTPASPHLEDTSSSAETSASTRRSSARNAAKRPRAARSTTTVSSDQDTPTTISDLQRSTVSTAGHTGHVFAGATIDPTHAAAIGTPAPISTKRKTKKEAKSTISRDYQGIPSGHGYPTNPPPEAEINTPWQCGEQNCDSGMSWLTRNRNASEGQAVGRKVISHYFGRNKSSTKLIPENVWHWLCRKHYQRDKYARDNTRNSQHPHQATCLWIADNIDHQLVRLELWRPQATFSVQLMSGAQKRLNDWFAVLRRHSGNQQAALAAMPAVDANAAPTPEKNFPITLLEHCNGAFIGHNKTYADLRQILAWVRTEVNAGNTPVMAPVEFLLNEQVAGEVARDHIHNYQEWEHHLAGTVFNQATAYTPGQSAKPRRQPPRLQPFTPLDPSHFENENVADDPEGAAIRNINKMGMIYKPKGGQEVRASTETAATSD